SMAELTVPTAESLRERLEAARKFLDLENKEVELQDLRAKAASPGPLDDPDTARQVPQRLANYEGLFERVNSLEQAIEDAEVLAELAAEAGDEASRAEAEEELRRVSAELDRLELESLFFEEYDEENAILTVHAGSRSEEHTSELQ